MIENGRYPVLKEDFAIHRQKDRCLIVNLRSLVSEIVDISGGEILGLCDGGRSTNEIVFHLAKKYQADAAEIKPIVVPFLGKSEHRGYIENLSEKAGRKILITGFEKTYMPISFSIELTKRCQLSCKHCYAGLGKGAKEKDLSFEEIEKVFALFHNMGAVNVFLTGGEAVLYPRFWDVLDIAVEQFLAVETVSNGYRIDGEIAELFKAKNAKGTVGVQISIDGLEEYHNNFRGKSDAFQRSIQAVRELALRGVPVRVGMNVNSDNIDMIEGLALASKNAGAMVFRIGGVLPLGNASSDSYKLSDEEMARIASLWKGLSSLEDERFMLQIPHDLQRLADVPVESGLNCGAGCALCHICVDGTVYPCPLLPVPMGNILTQPYEEVFGGAMADFFASLPTPSAEICGDCEELIRCERCHAAAWARNRNNSNCRWMKLWLK